MVIHRTESGVPRARSSILQLNGSQSAQVLAAGFETTTFTPPKGYLWTALDLYFHVKDKAGSAAGTQDVEIISGSVPKMFGSTAFGNALTWEFSEWASASVTKSPSDAGVALAALKGMVGDVDNTIRFIYTNNLDVTQTWGRSIYLTVRQTPIL